MKTGLDKSRQVIYKAYVVVKEKRFRVVEEAFFSVILCAGIV
jgi:hypothetical protein